MPANIEIKARVLDPIVLRQRAEQLSDSPVEVMTQVDTFFYTQRGRLKLRELGPAPAQLIFYSRPDATGPKRSDYSIFLTEQPAALKEMLSRALGVRGVVRKTRLLYLVGQTRIHLDEVEGLGHFLELEVVLREGQGEDEGQAIAWDVMRRLGVGAEALLEGAYIDLMEKRITSV